MMLRRERQPPKPKVLVFSKEAPRKSVQGGGTI